MAKHKKVHYNKASDHVHKGFDIYGDLGVKCIPINVYCLLSNVPILLPAPFVLENKVQSLVMKRLIITNR